MNLAKILKDIEKNEMRKRALNQKFANELAKSLSPEEKTVFKSLLFKHIFYKKITDPVQSTAGKIAKLFKSILKKEDSYEIH